MSKKIVKKAAKKQVKPTAIKKIKPVKKSAKPKVQKIAKKKVAQKPAVKKSSPKANRVKTKAPVPKKLTRQQKNLQKVQEFAQALMQHEQQEKKAPKQYPVLEGGASERISILLPILKELVKKNLISDWNINLHYERSASMYVERNFTIEDESSSIREDVQLTIFERFPDNTMGDAQLPIISTDPAVIRQQILDAKHTCAYSKKPAFNLPQPIDGISFPQSCDERMHKSIFGGSLQVPRDLYQQIKSIMAPITDVKLNSFELIANAGTARVLNSNGIDVSYYKTSIYVEFILTCKQEKGEEHEFIMSKMTVSPEQLNIQGLLLQQAQIVRDATHAKPNPGFNGNVLFAGPSITEFFAPHHDLNPMILHAMAKLECMNLSIFKKGQSIGTFTGEPITIISNPTLPQGLSTAPVDFEGNALKPVEIIRNGVFVNHIASARYGHYLQVPVTGMVANIQVSAGATREEHLRGNDYFEIVSFSWFNPNPFSGDVSAEIRLGYHWRNGRKTPFRGGTFTGNVFRNILNARFSKEVMQSGEYYGPRVVLFKDATITKME